MAKRGDTGSKARHTKNKWQCPKIALVMLTLLWGHAAEAQIAPAADGTGTTVNHSGNTYNITGGTTAGPNLFHSFTSFGLQTNETANFQSNPNIQNILGRVTGGNPSVINGLIKVTGSNANLLLMNPAGIVFGPNASLNLPAAFVATTANGIQFDTHWFNALGRNDYSLLTGTPAGFAFTTAQPGSIVNLGQLSVNPGQNLVLVGGTVVSPGSLQGGQITVSAVPGTSLVKISQAGHLLSLEINPLASQTGLNSDSQLPITSLPQLLTAAGVENATGMTVNPDGTVTLTGSAVAVQPGDVVAQSVTGENVTLSAPGNIQVGNLTTVETEANSASGSIKLESTTGNIDTTAGTLNGGLVSLTAAGNITTSNINARSATGNGGSISLVSGSTIDTSSGTLTARYSDDSVSSGKISLVATGNIAISRLTSGDANSNAGRLNLLSQQGEIIQSNDNDLSAVITTGNVKLGIFGKGNLGGSNVGLNLADVGDAIMPGCLCEGWGVAGNGIAAGASVANPSPGNLKLTAFSSTPTSATSVVKLASLPSLQITQAYQPAAAAPTALFENRVTITNTGTTNINDLRYTRAMDWDVPPTEFHELVTIGGREGNKHVLYSSDNGFASVNPLDPKTAINPETENTDFVNNGPTDHGAVFDFGFGNLASGSAKTFSTYYGATNSAATAMQALGNVKAEVFSLGQSAPEGGPGTFIFGFNSVSELPNNNSSTTDVANPPPDTSPVVSSTPTTIDGGAASRITTSPLYIPPVSTLVLPTLTTIDAGSARVITIPSALFAIPVPTTANRPQAVAAANSYLSFTNRTFTQLNDSLNLLGRGGGATVGNWSMSLNSFSLWGAQASITPSRGFRSVATWIGSSTSTARSFTNFHVIDDSDFTLAGADGGDNNSVSFTTTDPLNFWGSSNIGTGNSNDGASGTTGYVIPSDSSFGTTRNQALNSDLTPASSDNQFGSTGYFMPTDAMGDSGFLGYYSPDNLSAGISDNTLNPNSSNISFGVSGNDALNSHLTAATSSSSNPPISFNPTGGGLFGSGTDWGAIVNNFNPYSGHLTFGTPAGNDALAQDLAAATFGSNTPPISFSPSFDRNQLASSPDWGASNLNFDNPTGNTAFGQDVTAANASSGNQQVPFNPSGDLSIYGSSGNPPPLSFNPNGDLSIWGGDSNYSFAGSNNQLGFEPNLRGYIIANPEEFDPGDAGTGGPFGPAEGAGEGAPPEGIGPAGEPGGGLSPSKSGSSIPTITVNQLPPEAQTTINRINNGGPFPYKKDGTVFSNREGLLPPEPKGYYHEYTVDTPGASNRGARRIVTGQNGEIYYTDDHYNSFVNVKPK